MNKCQVRSKNMKSLRFLEGKYRANLGDIHKPSHIFFL